MTLQYERRKIKIPTVTKRDVCFGQQKCRAWSVANIIQSITFNPGREQKKFSPRIKFRIVIDGQGFRGNTSSEVAIPLLCFSLIWRTPMEEMIIL